MVKPFDRLRRCTGFQWDKGNETKNWDAHDVSQGECEKVFFNQPLIVGRDRHRSEIETRYYALGRTDMNRFLFVVFTVRGEKIRVISARDMTPHEKKRYQK